MTQTFARTVCVLLFMACCSQMKRAVCVPLRSARLNQFVLWTLHVVIAQSHAGFSHKCRARCETLTRS